jgi:hypothetical protein
LIGTLLRRIGMKLNLTDEQRTGVKVTFSVNKFEAYLPSGALLGKYTSKVKLAAEFRENNITGAMFDGISQRMYLANYGNFNGG